jgi:DNA modification methylase
VLDDLDIGYKSAERWQQVAQMPDDQFEKHLEDMRGEKPITTSGLIKELRTDERTEARTKLAEAGAFVPMSEKWCVYHGDIATWKAPRQYDFIITDPPYPKEYLPLWETLAQRAVEWLKPGGLLVAMSGQYWINDIYRMLDEHLAYFWTAAYLVPGESAGVFQKHINPQWKPLIMYQLEEHPFKGRGFSDVFKSEANDKDHHKWGQSESGMFDIVSKICLPGQYILDPFCGAGTTGIAAVNHGCFFDGLDISEENVNISRGRIGQI